MLNGGKGDEFGGEEASREEANREEARGGQCSADAGRKSFDQISEVLSP